MWFFTIFLFAKLTDQHWQITLLLWRWAVKTLHSSINVCDCNCLQINTLLLYLCSSRFVAYSLLCLFVHISGRKVGFFFFVFCLFAAVVVAAVVGAFVFAFPMTTTYPSNHTAQIWPVCLFLSFFFSFFFKLVLLKKMYTHTQLDAHI